MKLTREQLDHLTFVTESVEPGEWELVEDDEHGYSILSNGDRIAVLQDGSHTTCRRNAEFISYAHLFMPTILSDMALLERQMSDVTWASDSSDLSVVLELAVVNEFVLEVRQVNKGRPCWAARKNGKRVTHGYGVTLADAKKRAAKFAHEPQDLNSGDDR